MAKMVIKMMSETEAQVTCILRGSAAAILF